MDLGVHHDTRCEKHGNFDKRSDTNSETAEVLLDSTLLSANQIRGPERKVVLCVYIYIYIYK